nr:MAG TPA: Bcl-2-like protein [Caudoviricetes sp.]
MLLIVRKRIECCSVWFLRLLALFGGHFFLRIKNEKRY